MALLQCDSKAAKDAEEYCDLAINRIKKSLGRVSRATETEQIKEAIEELDLRLEMEISLAGEFIGFLLKRLHDHNVADLSQSMRALVQPHELGYHGRGLCAELPRADVLR